MFNELKRRRAEKEQRTKSGTQSPDLGEHISSSNDEYEGEGEKDGDQEVSLFNFAKIIS